MKTAFYSHGKLLLSGEYAVLDGALALAVPTSQGQLMEITTGTAPGLTWKSLEVDGNCWLETYFTPEQLKSKKQTGAFPKSPDLRLLQTLAEVQNLNPEFIDRCLGKTVITTLEFPRLWGLGTSSTFIANLAQWAGVDPYDLLDRTLGGSGYDLACATENSPLFYKKRAGGTPEVIPTTFVPPFLDQLWLVYLNTKQDSREGIERYKAHRPVSNAFLSQISELSTGFTEAKDIDAFQELMLTHEVLISELLGLKRVKERLFPDYPGAIKSLGAWGGDFILAAGSANTPEYFIAKGFSTVFPLQDLIL
jgi:mevalonate kinase